MPILGSSNSAANKDIMSKIWTVGDAIIGLSRKLCGKKEKLLVTSNFSFFHNVFKSCQLLMRQNEYLWNKGLKHWERNMSLQALCRKAIYSIFLYHITLTFHCPLVKGFLKIFRGKGENAGNQHFLFFKQCFLTCYGQNLLFGSPLFSKN